MKAWGSAKRIAKGEGINSWEKIGTFIFGVLAAWAIMAISGAIIGSRPVKTWWQKILSRIHVWSKEKHGAALLRLTK